MARLLWYLEITWDYLCQMLPCVLVAAALFFILRPLRVRKLARRGLTSSIRREGTLLFFVVFCAGLGALTLFQSGFWQWGHWYWVFRGESPVFFPVNYAHQLEALQIIPLQNILNGGGSGSWARYMLWGNIILFLPLGFFPALLWRHPRWWKSMLCGLCPSLFIEVVQFFIGRSSDINDILLNTLGALIGYWLFLLLRRFAPRFVKTFICQQQEALYGRKA